MKYILKNEIQYNNFENKNKLYQLIINDETIYYKGNVLDKMEKLRKMKPNSDEYNCLYDDIIKVQEYSCLKIKENNF